MVYRLGFVNSVENVSKLYDFLSMYSLNYPDYDLWLKKAKRQLELGDKKFFYVSYGKNIVGSVIFQPLKSDDSILEIKNIRVGEGFKRKGVASFLEFIVYRYAQINGYKKIQLDTSKDNYAVLSFFLKKNYSILGEDTLYSSDRLEVILSKNVHSSIVYGVVLFFVFSLVLNFKFYLDVFFSFFLKLKFEN